jgi:hypothetical protein
MHQTRPLEGQLTITALFLATLDLLLTSGFLFQGYYPNGQSLASPAPHAWLILNWVSLIGWVLACIMTGLGKGRLRFPLFLWCLGILFSPYIALMTGFTY